MVIQKFSLPQYLFILHRKWLCLFFFYGTHTYTLESFHLDQRLVKTEVSKLWVLKGVYFRFTAVLTQVPHDSTHYYDAVYSVPFFDLTSNMNWVSQHWRRLLSWSWLNGGTISLVCLFQFSAQSFHIQFIVKSNSVLVVLGTDSSQALLIPRPF